jgi:plastocyanin
MARHGWTAAVALSLLTLASCARERRPPSVTHTITMDAVSFQPQALTVHAGDTIVWVNKDPFPHTATASGGAFDSDQIAPDASWTWTVSGAGTISYICRFHPTMTGTVRVEK